MSFFEKSLTTLELPSVLNMLAAEAVGESAKGGKSTQPFARSL